MEMILTITPTTPKGNANAPKKGAILNNNPTRARNKPIPVITLDLALEELEVWKLLLSFILKNKENQATFLKTNLSLLSLQI